MKFDLLINSCCKQKKKCTETKNRFVLFLRDAIFIGVAVLENWWCLRIFIFLLLFRNRAIHRAAENGHADVVRRLLREPNSGINSETDNQQTPINLAAYRGRTDVVRVSVQLNLSLLRKLIDFYKVSNENVNQI